MYFSSNWCQDKFWQEAGIIAWCYCRKIVSDLFAVYQVQLIEPKYWERRPSFITSVIERLIHKVKLICIMIVILNDCFTLCLLPIAAVMDMVAMQYGTVMNGSGFGSCSTYDNVTSRSHPYRRNVIQTPHQHLPSPPSSSYNVYQSARGSGGPCAGQGRDAPFLSSVGRGGGYGHYYSASSVDPSSTFAMSATPSMMTPSSSDVGAKTAISRDKEALYKLANLLYWFISWLVR